MPSVAFAKPRKICDKITPEFPRAPIKRPFANAALRSPTFLLVSLRSYLAPLAIEEVMFVPVSPSGTGKTFNELINSAFLPSLSAAAWTILPNSRFVIFVTANSKFLPNARLIF